MTRLRLLIALALAACAPEPNIHQTKQATTQPCINCHSAAYVQVRDPPHMGVKPVTCELCHTTTGWVPTIGSAGHPEDRFPIASGKHKNPAIGCNDCHDPTQGPSTGGMNTNCIHCHIGAHTIASIDAVHASLGVMGYPPANEATPHSCLDCHPSGMR